MTKPLPMPELGRCPYCGHRLKAYTTTALDFVPRVSHTYCPNDRCCENRDYATERGAINAANRRVT